MLKLNRNRGLVSECGDLNEILLVFILSLSCRISSVNQELFFDILALGIQDFSMWEIMCAYGINYTETILCIILYSLLGYFHVISL